MDRELSPDTIVLQCVDLRRRLRQTEQYLHGLTELENGVPVSDNEEIRRLLGQRQSSDLSRGNSPRPVPLLTMEDLSPRELENRLNNPDLNSSASSSLGSLRAFRTPTLPSSTPKVQTTRSVYGQEAHRRSSSEHSPSAVRQDIIKLQEERRLLKEEIAVLRDENSHLLARNQGLVHDVEGSKIDAKRMSEKIRMLNSELNRYRMSFPDLEEKIASLSAETKSQDDALRKAEERCELVQKELAETKNKLAKMKQEHDTCTEDVTEERKLRKRMESQRDTAFDELNQLQDLLNAYQRKSKDKIAKLEEKEDNLRDNLSHANEEREELLEKSSLLQDQMYELEEEIRLIKDQTGVDLESKADLEKDNVDLKTRLKQQTKQLESLQIITREKEALKEEKCELTAKVESQDNQLVKCQQEITESRLMLNQLERLVEQIQRGHGSRAGIGNDSGVGSLLSDRVRGQSGNRSQGVRGSKSNSDQSDIMTFLSSKDTEVKGMGYSPRSKAGDRQFSAKPANLLESLRSELLSSIEKGKLWERKCEEMETMLNQLETERSQLNTEISDMRRESSDRDAICSSLESHLKQRENQLTELQEELSLKSSTVRNLERELRKKSAQMTALEEQLDDKVGEFTMHVTRLKLQEDDAAGKMEEIYDLKSELAKKEKKLKEVGSATETVKRIQQEQFKEFEKQIDILQDELEKKIQETKDLTSDLDNLNLEVEAKDAKIAAMNKELMTSKKELTEKRGVEKKMLMELESQTNLATNQIKDLENALFVCRDEMGSYIKQLDKSKDQFDKEINNKNKQLTLLDRELKEAYLEGEEKEQRVVGLERSIQDQQRMLQQSSGRISELEDSQAELQTQISHLEQKLLREKGQWVEEARSMERKLHGACAELGTRATQLTDLTDTMQILQTDKLRLERELTELNKELTDVKQDYDKLNNKMSQLEKENRDLRVMVEQKTEIVQDLEDQLKYKTDTIEEHNEKLKDKEQRFEDLKAEVKSHKARTAEVKDQLQHSQFDCKAKEQLLDDLRESLRGTQELLNESQERIRDLEKGLEERLWELHQRAAQVSKLEGVMKEYQERVEQTSDNQRIEMERLQDDLHHTTKQLSDVDDKLQDTERHLREVTLQLKQSQQTIGRLENEVKEKTNEITAKQERLNVLTKTQDGHKEDLAETTQELRLAREQVQQLNGELRIRKQELVESQREADKLSREMERSSSNCQQHQHSIATIQKEVETLKEREKLLEMRVASEATRHEQETDRINLIHQEELAKLQESYANVLSSNEQLSAQGRLHQKELEESTRQTETELSTTQKKMSHLEAEMQAKNTTLNSIHETMVLKDSEIARLQARICRTERDVGMRAAEQWISTRDSVTGSSMYSGDINGQSSGQLIYPENSIGHTVLTNYSENAIGPQSRQVMFPESVIGHKSGHMSLSEDMIGQHSNMYGREHIFQPNSFSDSMLLKRSVIDNRYSSQIPNRDIEINRPQAMAQNQRLRSSKNSGEDLKDLSRGPSDSRKFVDTSESDSDREICRRFAENLTDSDQNQFVGASNSDSKEHSISPGTQKLARTLTFEDTSSDLNNSNSTGSKLPARDQGKGLSKSASELNSKDRPLKSALKSGKDSRNVRYAQQKNHLKSEKLQNSKRQISKPKLGTDNSNVEYRNTVPNPSAKRQSHNFELHDFENAVTAVQQYRSPDVHLPTDSSAIFSNITMETDTDDPALSVEDLQEKLRANELKQLEIDRQLLSLESEFEVSQDIDISQ